MKKIFYRVASHHRAETLIEVLMSLSVLMIILTPASALNFQSTRNRAMDRHYTIAAPLAESGLGMVNGIRSTNLLRFSPKAAQCWNTKPSYNDIENCELPANKIAAGPYTIGGDTQNPLLPIELSLQAAPLDVASPQAAYELKLDEDLTTPGCDTPGLPQGTPCHTHFVDDTHLYNYKQGQASGFYREIKIEYPSAEPFMVVTSTLVFRNGSKYRTITLAQGLINQAPPP